MNRTSPIIVFATITLIAIVLLIPDNPKQKFDSALPLITVIFGIGVVALFAGKFAPSHEEQVRDIFLCIWSVLLIWEIIEDS